MAIRNVLIADDENVIRCFLVDVVKRKNFKITAASNGMEAINHLKNGRFDLVITDMKMPYASGLEVLKAAKEANPDCIVIVISGFSTVEDAVEAMRQGAFNYLTKPVSLETIEAMLEKAEEHLDLIEENRSLRHEISEHCPKNFSNIIAESEQMKKILTDVETIAKSDSNVFISGESGTGKEEIAKAIHAYSKRCYGPFIKVNCSAIPESLIESEFFGHEKGAFTGAINKRLGRFELAHDGILMLDEVSETPLSLQSKLLRAIQELEFERVGGSRPIKVNVRFVATSNRNMKEAIDQKSFREDLYYRLNVIPVNLPALRERKDDILPLSYFFLKKICEKSGKAIKQISSAAKEKLSNYYWPGNIRELANVIERTVVMLPTNIIEAEHLRLDFSVKESAENFNNEAKIIPLHEVEKAAILKTLASMGNNKTKAAEALGITVKTLRHKLQ